MSKFALICKGTRATKLAVVPLRSEPEPVEMRCLVRPLSGAEEASAIEAALAFAKARGDEAPKPGDVLYEFGLWVHTIVIGCRDEENAEAPYFANAEEALEHLDRDRIALLFELQQKWQDECSPRLRAMDAEAYRRSIEEIATLGDDAELPFERWAPAMRASWVRFTARQLAIFYRLRSHSGSPSETATTNGTATT